MKFSSNLLAQASGSLAGTVFSHNKGGMYVRNRSIPTNPATAAQQNVRNALKQLTTGWADLTAAQRLAWSTYATNVPILNKLGAARPIPALAMYLRCNSPRLANDGPTAVVPDGPTIYSLATFTIPTISVTANHIVLAYTNTDDWAIADGGFMYLYVSKPQNQTINFFKGPYNFLGEIAGDTMTPPTSPHTFSGLTLVTGVRYFVRINVTNADGRLSSSALISFNNPS